MSGRFCSTPNRTFFKTEALGPQEAPDGVVTDAHAPGGKFFRQSVKGQVGCLLQPGADPVPLRRQQNRPVTPAFAGLQRPGAILKVCPFHHRRRRNAEPVPNNPAALATAIRRNRPLSKINRIVPSHRRSSPGPVLKLNQNSNSTGILPILSKAERL